MNRIEHLIVIVAEECAELAQRASKAQRFGMSEVEPGKTESNARRLFNELMDLRGAIELLALEPDAAELLQLLQCPVLMSQLIDFKRTKIETFLEYSRQVGTLQEVS
jgi:hypothetical protein